MHRLALLCPLFQQCPEFPPLMAARIRLRERASLRDHICSAIRTFNSLEPLARPPRLHVLHRLAEERILIRRRGPERQGRRGEHSGMGRERARSANCSKHGCGVLNGNDLVLIASVGDVSILSNASGVTDLSKSSNKPDFLGSVGRARS